MRLKELREEEGLKQADLARLLNIKQNTYSQYETEQRQIPINVLIKLAKYYNVSVDYLLNLTDTVEPYPRKIK
ncbi:MAG: helix-turn-helix domain-containing protein [Bacteroides sp.]|nr:helix-turn-helix domain-containing protein [Bacillota bacterium]MCM1393825.1 helix-turn-helix domain-containing protein [[Eubacterium] siraeum]MCM1455456.1 helix-turn-helix domain-containing protein [Bacteroides sp.]